MWPSHRCEPTAMSPQLPFYRQRLAVAHPYRWASIPHFVLGSR